MSDPDALTYPHDAPPVAGTTQEVAPGVYWLQMPLPMSLKYINLYLLEDTDGWTVVDTGIRGEETRELWGVIADNCLNGKPITRIVCTHMHPDHTGQAGHLFETWRAPLYMSFREYYQARNMFTMMSGPNWQMTEYFQRTGLTFDFQGRMKNRKSDFQPQQEDRPIPPSFIRLSDGDTFRAAGQDWQILTGSGHSPEHVCLYNPDLRVLISGDQILPIITSNVSVFPSEPEGNPMVGWLESHERFKQLLPNDILVLPAHNLPFYGVQERLQQLIDHHEDRMLIIEENCVEPVTAVDLLPHLFNRKLEDHTRFMAVDECIAHIHCLMGRGRLERILENDVYHYRSIDPSLSDRARSGQHELLDDAPEMV